MLLDAGCDIDAPCPDAGWRGKSALAAAVDGGEPAAVRLLLQLTLTVSLTPTLT